MQSLIKLLDQFNGPRIITLTIRTEPELLKKHRISKELCPFTKGITKITQRVGIIGASYKNVVNNWLGKLGAVGDFEPQALWNGNGEHVGNFLVRHKQTGQLYLAFMPLGKKPVKQVITNNLNDSEIKKEDLEPYLSISKSNRLIMWETIKIENIAQLKSGKIFYNKES